MAILEWAQAKRREGDTENGFSLVELMVVVLIMGILCAAAIPVFVGQRNKALEAAENVESAPTPESVPVAPAPVTPGPSAGEVMAPVLGITGSVVGVVVGLGILFGIFMFFRGQHKKAQAIRKTLAGRKALLADLETRFDATVRSIGQYETDVALAIDYPAFNDVTVPEVSSMVKAMSVAKNARMAIGSVNDDIGPYQEAVAGFEVAFLAAKHSAERIAWSTIPLKERKDLKSAKHLLVQASDPGNTEEARATYRAQLLNIIQRINRAHGAELIPAKIVVELESSTMLELAK